MKALFNSFLTVLKENKHFSRVFQSIQQSFLVSLLVKFTVFIVGLYIVIQYPVVYITLAATLATYIIFTVLWVLCSSTKEEVEKDEQSTRK